MWVGLNIYQPKSYFILRIGNKKIRLNDITDKKYFKIMKLKKFNWIYSQKNEIFTINIQELLYILSFWQIWYCSVNIRARMWTRTNRKWKWMFWVLFQQKTQEIQIYRCVYYILLYFCKIFIKKHIYGQNCFIRHYRVPKTSEK